MNVQMIRLVYGELCDAGTLSTIPLSTNPFGTNPFSTIPLGTTAT